MKMKCGCVISPGRRLSHSGIREHLTHVREGIIDAMERVLMLELIVGLNHDGSNLSDVRSALMNGLDLWEKKTLPALEEKLPENKIAEAPGL
jgi:hypothetical protein